MFLQVPYDKTAMICVGPKDGGKGSCKGDSGGPVVLMKGKDAVLIAIVSHAYKCAKKGYPSSDTRVTTYLSFIKKTMMSKGGLDLGSAGGSSGRLPALPDVGSGIAIVTGSVPRP